MPNGNGTPGYYFTQALLTLRPGSNWVSQNGTYAQLVWKDPNTTKPTEAEVTATMQTLADASDANNLQKVLRAILLAAGGMAGKTPAQTKAAFKTAWDALP